MVGSDPDQLARLAKEMIQAGDDLDRRRQRLHRLVESITWKGAVAERLKSQFLGIGLGPIVDLLHKQGAELRKQAIEQRLASSAQGGNLARAVEIAVPFLFGLSALRRRSQRDVQKGR